MFCIFRPQSTLSDFINIFWLYKGYHPPHEMEHVLPDGSMELVINLQEDLIKVYDQKKHDRFRGFNGSLLSGPHSHPAVIDTACQAYTIGVHFKPGGAFPFLKLPIIELHNNHVTLDTVWGVKAAEMRERLLEAEMPTAKFQILEHYLIEVMTKDSSLHPAVSFAIKKFQAFPQQLKIADVTEQISLSPRQFIQVFKDNAGLTPKQFCRIQRFQIVLRSMKDVKHVDWAGIALSCGYYDQAHFIHDFRAFSGFSPTTYHSQPGKQQNHIPLDL